MSSTTEGDSLQLALARRLERDPLGALTEASRLGEVVRLGPAEAPRFLVREPRHIAEVLQEHRERYDKQTRPYLRTRALFGDGLLTSDGEAWLRRRRTVQPAFEPASIRQHFEVVVEAAQELLDALRVGREGAPIDVGRALSRATSSILTRLLFGRPHPELAQQWCEVVGERLDLGIERSPEATAAAEQRAAEVGSRLDAAIADAEPRIDGQPRPAMLQALLDARSRSEGTGLDAAALRDEVATLLFAGSETTASAVGWALLLLARNPRSAARVREELRGLRGDGGLRIEDLEQLSYTRMVLDESLRLYPPAWSITRRATVDHELGDEPIPQGAVIMVSQWVTHRLPGLWEEPEVFDPERFEPARSSARPRFSFFPFLGGPRQCVGAALANLEALTVLAVLLPRLQLRTFPLSPGWPEPWVTLRPRGGLWLVVEEIPS